MLTLATFCFLFGSVVFAQAPASQKAANEMLTIESIQMQKGWTGDLDGMIERRVIRVLTVHSKTFYFTDKGTQRGTVVDTFRLFESELNKKLAAEHRIKNKNLKVRVVFIPLPRDLLLSGLAAGKGDIVAANLTITPERQKLVDFTVPLLSNVNEVVVAGPASPKSPVWTICPARKSSFASHRAITRASLPSTCSLRPKTNRRSRSRKLPRRWRTRICLSCSTPASLRPSSLTSTRRTSGSRYSRNSPCTTASRFTPAGKWRGQYAKAARSSRQCWTVSSPATRSGQRSATNS